MSGKVRHIDYSPDEYISGVGGKLRADEQGVYWMICTLIMSEGEAIDRDDRRLSGLCRIRPTDAARITDKLISMGKIRVGENGRMYQNRALSEVERSANRIQTASENGSKGGRPTKKSELDQRSDKAAGYSVEKLSQTTNEQLVSGDGKEPSRPKPAKRRISYPPKFLEFWSLYPTDALMSKAAAGKAFSALSEEDQDAAIKAIPAFRAYCSAHADYRPVHAVRFLTQGRFEGFNQTAVKVSDRVFVAMGTPTWEAIRLKRNVATMMHKEHRGERGWWFDKAEIERAMTERSAA